MDQPSLIHRMFTSSSGNGALLELPYFYNIGGPGGLRLLYAGVPNTLPAARAKTIGLVKNGCHAGG